MWKGSWSAPVGERSCGLWGGDCASGGGCGVAVRAPLLIDGMWRKEEGELGGRAHGYPPVALFQNEVHLLFGGLGQHRKLAAHSHDRREMTCGHSSQAWEWMGGAVREWGRGHAMGARVAGSVRQGPGKPMDVCTWHCPWYHRWWIPPRAGRRAVYQVRHRQTNKQDGMEQGRWAAAAARGKRDG